MPVLQEFIHRLEVGGGIRSFGRYFYITVGAIAVLLLCAGYNFRAYRNFSTMEAMDTAQLGRNIAEGRGYTTRFVRPFSMHLLQQAAGTTVTRGPDGQPDPFRIHGEHPDLANPPVYPLILAGLMYTLPLNYQAENTNWFWSIPTRSSPGSSSPITRSFYRYQPDFIIALFNQALFGVCVFLTFLIARRLFDPTVAWVSAILVLGTELLWRFSVSGLSTMLLIGLFLGLFWVLMRLDRDLADPDRPLWQLLLLAALTGLLVGLGGLTRYSFAWLIFPLVAWLAIFGGKGRWLLALSAFAAFLLVLSPWVIRNLALSGTPFGTATYALLEGTPLYPEFRLQRSLQPGFDFNVNLLNVMTHKIVTHSRQIVTSDLPQLGGTWLSAFFVVGLLVGYQKAPVRRLRYFLISCLVVLTLVQALGGTAISETSPVLSTENLLVLLAPLIIIYGTSLFFLLLETVEFAFRELRYAAIGLFVLAASLPLVLALMPPKTSPSVWPPYHPPVVQKVAAWMKPNELTMSDQPWALAWYGNMQCVWLTLNSRSDFLAINDYQKQIQLLFLSRMTTDGRFASEVVHGGKDSWGEFVVRSYISRSTLDFPLRVIVPDWAPDFFILMGWERWRKPGERGSETSPAQP